MVAECNGSYHDCYRRLYRLIRERDKSLAAAFDGPSRSNAFILLANMIGEELSSVNALFAEIPIDREHLLGWVDLVAERLGVGKSEATPWKRHRL